MATRKSSSLTPVGIGPWPRGLNNRESSLFSYSDRDIRPDELIRCSNMDIRENGVLVSRPGLALYGVSVLQNILDLDTSRLRNVIGPIRIDSNYDESLVQVVDNSSGNNVYLLRCSVTDGKVSDFTSGYFLKQSYDDGAEFYMTSVCRYDDVIYFTCNDTFVTDDSTFDGGFSRTNVLESSSTTYSTNYTPPSSGSDGAWARDSDDNIYFLDYPNKKIKKIAKSDGSVTDFATTSDNPIAICCIKSLGHVYVCMVNPDTDTYSIGLYDGSSSSNYNDTVKYKSIAFDSSTSTVYVIGLDGLNLNLYSIPANLSSSTTKVKTLVSGAGSGAGSYAYDISSNLVINSANSTLTYIQKYTPWATASSHILIVTDLSGNTLRQIYISGAYIYNSIDVDSNDNIYIGTSNGDIIVYDTSFTSTFYHLASSFNTSFLVGILSDSTIVYYDNISATVYDYTPVNTIVVTNITAMPFGDISFILKDRMFIINKNINRVYYSEATDPTTWDSDDGGGFFDVEPGDGLSITSAAVSNDQIYIFKATKTYVFTYTADPGSDGDLRTLSTDTGSYDSCVFNNIVYLVGPQGIQRLVNEYFTDISQQIKVYHRYIIANSSIVVHNNKLYVTVNNTDNVLVMNLYTGAWSTYALQYQDSSSHIYSLQFQSKLFNVGNGKIICAAIINNLLFVVGIGTTTGLDIYNDTDDSDYTIPEYNVFTKVYDFGTPTLWKRMMKFYSDIACGFLQYKSDYEVQVFVGLTTESDGYDPQETLIESDTVFEPHTDLPIQKVPVSGYSSFRFQNVMFVINTTLSVPDSVPSILITPQLAIKSLSGYFIQKGSKAEVYDTIS